MPLCRRLIQELGVIMALNLKILANKPIGYRLSVLWLGVCAVFSIFGELFPLPAWDY